MLSSGPDSPWSMYKLIIQINCHAGSLVVKIWVMTLVTLWCPTGHTLQWTRARVVMLMPSCLGLAEGSLSGVLSLICLYFSFHYYQLWINLHFHSLCTSVSPCESVSADCSDTWYLLHNFLLGKQSHFFISSTIVVRASFSHFVFLQESVTKWQF